MTTVGSTSCEWPIGTKVRMGNKPASKGLLQGLSLSLLGFFLIVLGAAVPIFAHAPFLAFILMSLPAIVSGVVALLHGIAVLFTRIVISGSQISLVVPEWRGFPVLPLRRVSVRWDELLAIRHRKEVYQLLAAFSFPVDVYALDTSRGRIVLSERSLPGIRQLLMELIGRTGLVIQEEGEVAVGLFQVLLKGSPPWRGE